jgi:hypothetical protein
MTFSIAHWMLEMIVSSSSMEGEDILEHTNGKFHGVYILLCKRKIFLSILMSSVICVHISQLVDHYVTYTYYT